MTQEKIDLTREINGITARIKDILSHIKTIKKVLLDDYILICDRPKYAELIYDNILRDALQKQVQLYETELKELEEKLSLRCSSYSHPTDSSQHNNPETKKK